MSGLVLAGYTWTMLGMGSLIGGVKPRSGRWYVAIASVLIGAAVNVGVWLVSGLSLEAVVCGQ